MNIRHTLIATLLLAFPVAPVLPLLAQEPNPPAQQNQQLDPQSTPSEQPPLAAPQPGPQPNVAQPMLQPRPAPPARTGWHRFDEPDPVEHSALPMNLTLPAGTWLNVRLDQGLSSDHNKPGDIWTATLTQPLIVDGRILAQRGQIVGGTVVEAQKSGHGNKQSRLALDLNQLTLADGRQVHIQSRLIEFHAPPMNHGREAAAVLTTVGVGAAIGGAVGGGAGAGIGAAGGVVASAVGVMLTPGKPTILYPESLLTFRLETPFTFAVNTETDLRAFAPVQPNDYQSQRGYRSGMNFQGSVAPPAPYAYPYTYPYAYPYGYWPYYYSPFYYGPGFGLYLGGGWGWGGGWRGGWGGGFRGGRR
jgi:hypothetical protein